MGNPFLNLLLYFSVCKDYNEPTGSCSRSTFNSLLNVQCQQAVHVAYNIYNFLGKPCWFVILNNFPVHLIKCPYNDNHNCMSLFVTLLAFFYYLHMKVCMCVYICIIIYTWPYLPKTWMLLQQNCFCDWFGTVCYDFWVNPMYTICKLMPL